MPRLRIQRGDEVLLEHRLRSGRTTIGRADQCDIALPGTTISRLHCTLRGSTQKGWRVDDHSRHGTQVDGRPVVGHAALHDGARVDIGDFSIIMVLSSAEARPTAPREPDRSHEHLIEAHAGGYRVERAALVVEAGPGAGQRYVLRSARVSIGGVGSQLVLPDSELIPEHTFLRVSRGRVMVEPGHGMARLDGERVRAITPLYADEELIVANTRLRVEPDTHTEPAVSTHFGEMVAHSRGMQTLFGTLRRMAGHHYTVLIFGESGTGKELIARGLHEHSANADGPFIALNCGAIRPDLFESAMFGHEKGAFTGAEERTDGAFRAASGGTLFLDEVGELPADTQASLLRVLETGEVQRVGGTHVDRPEVRVVAATNRNLAASASQGTFREDLYFRLAVLSVEVPPLRKRRSDVPVLARHLARKMHPEAHITEEAMAMLKSHDWPGNVRELRNVLTRAYVLNGARIDLNALSFHTTRAPKSNRTPDASELAERELLAAVMKRHSFNRTAAARELGIARSTLFYRLKRHGLG